MAIPQQVCHARVCAATLIVWSECLWTNMHAVECKACTSSASERACVSHNSRLIKLLHSNEPSLTVCLSVCLAAALTTSFHNWPSHTHAPRCTLQHETYHNYGKKKSIKS